MPPTTEDPNRTCWNCKHFAPEDRETSPDGECRFYPPRYDLIGPFFFFPGAFGVEWCGKWERNAATVGVMPIRALREEEPTREPTNENTLTINMENTVSEMREFAESNDIDLEGAKLKEEIFALIETRLDGE